MNNSVKMSHVKRTKKDVRAPIHLSPTQVILIGFAALILLGTLLLCLPISSAEGNFTSVRTSMFTAVSATCVTGLIIEDTGTYFSTFGHIVILTLIQIGGLGFMTMAVMMSIFIKRQITPRERLLVAQSLGLSGVGGTVKLVRRILIGTLIVESSGAVILSTQFVPILGWSKGIFCGIFHSVSAFCNAGFDILGAYGGEYCSFTPFDHNYIVGTTLILLIVIGGIGFIVWDDLVNFIKLKKRFSPYSKLIIAATAVLIAAGTLFIALGEWNNPETLAGESIGHKLFASLFQSVTTRTAGIDMINNAAMTENSKLVSMLLMFVGGASGSTAGGIKVGTLAVIIAAMLAFARGSDDLVIQKHRVPHETVIRALTIVGLDLVGVIAAAMIITATGELPMMTALYESFSAIATVGLSLSATPALSLAGHIAIMVLMFFGRVGVLTITYSILLKGANKNSCIRYPDINMMIG